MKDFLCHVELVTLGRELVTHGGPWKTSTNTCVLCFPTGYNVERVGLNQRETRFVSTGNTFLLNFRGDGTRVRMKAKIEDRGGVGHRN